MKTLANLALLLAAQERHDVNVLRIATIAANGEGFVIGSETFPCVTTAENPFEFEPGADAAGSIANIVDVINDNSAQDLTAVAITGGVLVYSNRSGSRRLACTETLAGANNAWAAAAMYGGTETALDGAFRNFDIVSFSPTATDVAVGSTSIVLGFEPAAVEAFVRTSAGAVKAWDGALSKSGRVVTLGNGGSVDWAATDVIVIVAAG
jgi:hypothetical protein